MQVQFQRPVTFGKATYGKGVHSVPASLADDWYFKAMQKDGHAVILRADEPENLIEAEAIIDPATLKPEEVIVFDVAESAELEKAETVEEAEAIIEKKINPKKKAK